MALPAVHLGTMQGSFFILFYLSYHIIQLTPQELSAEPRNSASAGALAVATPRAFLASLLRAQRRRYHILYIYMYDLFRFEILVYTIYMYTIYIYNVQAYMDMQKYNHI